MKLNSEQGLEQFEGTEKILLLPDNYNEKSLNET